MWKILRFAKKDEIIVWMVQVVDVVSIHEEMVGAIEVMDEIEDIVIKFLPRVIPHYLLRYFS